MAVVPVDGKKGKKKDTLSCGIDFVPRSSFLLRGCVLSNASITGTGTQVSGAGEP